MSIVLRGAVPRRPLGATRGIALPGCSVVEVLAPVETRHTWAQTRDTWPPHRGEDGEIPPLDLPPVHARVAGYENHRQNQQRAEPGRETLTEAFLHTPQPFKIVRNLPPAGEQVK
jgi:hypothetical protein